MVPEADSEETMVCVVTSAVFTSLLPLSDFFFFRKKKPATAAMMITASRMIHFFFPPFLCGFFRPPSFIFIYPSAY